MKRLLVASLALVAALPLAAGQTAAAQAINSGARYATDAYPGFDEVKESTHPEKKTPKWFSWLTGPKMEDSAAQFSYCRGLIAEESYSKAVRELDALVREWPVSGEAPEAQRLLAETLETKLRDCEEAFREWRYLVDFYSVQCDYSAAVDALYRVASVMRIEGKTIMFFRFKNTADVRRALEACVLRAPGAEWAPQAMLEIASLREDEMRWTEAIKVYENLRNLHRGTPEAKTALVREAAARMMVLEEMGYNRERVRDTIAFLEQAEGACEGEDREAVRAQLDEARALIDDDDFAAAKFYDSRIRTKRSAVSAYETYLANHPRGSHADAARARLEELKKGSDQ